GGLLPGDAVEDLDVPAGADGPAGDDLGLAVAVEVRRADAEAAGEARVGELAQHRRPGGRVEGLQVRAAPEGAGDQLGAAVAVEVAGRQGDAAGEARVGGEIAQGAGNAPDEVVGSEVVRGDAQAGDRERPHVRLGAGCGRDRDLGPAVVVEIPRGDE